jgi:hypothetical protein
MNRYSIINKESTHACMEQSPAGDWVTYQDAQQLANELDDIRAALLHGADESLWPPGMTIAQAIEKIITPAAPPNEKS